MKTVRPNVNIHFNAPNMITHQNAQRLFQNQTVVVDSSSFGIQTSSRPSADALAG